MVACQTAGVTLFMYICSPQCITRQWLVVGSIKPEGEGHCAEITGGSFWLRADRSLNRDQECHGAVGLGIGAAGVVGVDLGAVHRLPHLAQLGERGTDTIGLLPLGLDSRVDLGP